MEFNVDDTVKVIAKNDSDILSGSPFKSRDIGIITRKWLWDGRNNYGKMLYRIDSKWNFFGRHLELLSHQERLNRKYGITK